MISSDHLEHVLLALAQSELYSNTVQLSNPRDAYNMICCLTDRLKDKMDDLTEDDE